MHCVTNSPTGQPDTIENVLSQFHGYLPLPQQIKKLVKDAVFLELIKNKGWIGFYVKSRISLHLGSSSSWGRDLNVHSSKPEVEKRERKREV